MAQKEKDRFKLFYALSFAWQLGFLIVVPLAGFLFLGYLVDKVLHTHPLFLIIGLIVSFIITVYEIYQLVFPIIKK